MTISRYITSKSTISAVSKQLPRFSRELFKVRDHDQLEIFFGRIKSELEASTSESGARKLPKVDFRLPTAQISQASDCLNFLMKEIQLRQPWKTPNDYTVNIEGTQKQLKLITPSDKFAWLYSLSANAYPPSFSSARTIYAGMTLGIFAEKLQILSQYGRVKPHICAVMYLQQKGTLAFGTNIPDYSKDGGEKTKIQKDRKEQIESDLKDSKNVTLGDAPKLQYAGGPGDYQADYGYCAELLPYLGLMLHLSPDQAIDVRGLSFKTNKIRDALKSPLDLDTCKDAVIATCRNCLTLVEKCGGSREHYDIGKSSLEEVMPALKYLQQLRATEEEKELENQRST